MARITKKQLIEKITEVLDPNEAYERNEFPNTSWMVRRFVQEEFKIERVPQFTVLPGVLFVNEDNGIPTRVDTVEFPKHDLIVHIRLEHWNEWCFQFEPIPA